MRSKQILSSWVVCILILVVSASTVQPVQMSPIVPEAVTTRVSTHADGSEGDDGSYTPSMTATGDFIAFVSLATNLTDNTTNGTQHVFVKNMQTGVVSLVSRATHGAEGDSSSSDPVISGDGQFIVFESLATNLVTTTVNAWMDVFVHDSETFSTTLVSIASDGTPANAASQSPDISADGRYIVFQSTATNLVGGDLSHADIFLHDRDADADGILDEPGEISTFRVSENANGDPANGPSTDPVISTDGRFIVYASLADNLVADDTNNATDIFLYDRDVDENGIFDEPGQIALVLISMGYGGVPADNFSLTPSISPDGSQVAFESFATNLIPGGTSEFQQHVFVRDWAAGTTFLVSLSSEGLEGDNGSYESALSENGRFIVFESLAENLVANDTNLGRDIFLRDRDVDNDGVFDEPGQVTTTRVSVATDGEQMDGGQAYNGSISGDGELIAFESDANDLILNDDNMTYDVYLHNRQSVIPPTGADLNVDVTGQRTVLGLSSNMVVFVSNLGPELATNVIVQKSAPGAVVPNWQPSQGACELFSGHYCTLGEIANGNTASISVDVSLVPNDEDVYQGSIIVSAEASSSIFDPISSNNADFFVTNFYQCSVGNQCILDEIVCGLFDLFPPLALPSGLEETGPYIPELALYYHLRDEMLTTPDGQYYTDLYYTHSDEALDLLLADSDLWDLALDGLLKWEAHFAALVDGEGESAVITAAQIQAVEDFLDALSLAGSPTLQQAIADERAKLPPFDTFIGMTMEAARGEVIGYAVYLPVMTK